jgi:MOSC domain-containing protein YiiM
MPQIVSIAYTPQDVPDRRPQDHFARVPAERVRLVENRGIDGDAKGRPGERQVNLMCAEVLVELAAEGFKTASGALGEQIVIRGIPAADLVPGVRLQLGDAVVEVTLPRTGCERFERIQGKTKESAKGGLGVLVRVVTGGEVAVGDAVELLPPAAAS